MPINAGHEFFEAEKKYLAAQTLEEKIETLRVMIRKAPKHKGSENLLAELKTRLKKFLEKLDKNKKAGKGKKGIKKEGFQVVLVGKTNGGKSTLLSKLTNAKPRTSENPFTTREPELGTMDYEGVKVQIVDLQSIGSREFDYGLVNNADCLLIVVDELGDLKEIRDYIKGNKEWRIVVINKVDMLDEEGKRKLDARCKAKRLNCKLISAKSGEGISDLKENILIGMKVVRVYTKEPGKDKNNDPVVLSEGATVKDVAETIYKGFSRQVKEARLTGPSGKFSNQIVGMKHKLKDKDVLEFKI